MAENNIFRVIFVQDEEVIEIYAKQVTESDMFGFLLVEDFLFGEKSSVVVDPSEERLKNTFNGVNCTYIPMHAIVRIDEVQKQGVAKITQAGKGGNVSHFPAGFLKQEQEQKKDK